MKIRSFDRELFEVSSPRRPGPLDETGAARRFFGPTGSVSKQHANTVFLRDGQHHATFNLCPTVKFSVLSATLVFVVFFLGAAILDHRRRQQTTAEAIQKARFLLTPTPPGERPQLDSVDVPFLAALPDWTPALARRLCAFRAMRLPSWQSRLPVLTGMTRHRLEILWIHLNGNLP